MISTLLNNGAEVFPVRTNIVDDESTESNLGMTIYKDNIVINFRAISYIPNLFYNRKHISENYIGEWKGEQWIQTNQLPWIDHGARVWELFGGREDMRLVVWDGVLYGYATRTDVRDDEGIIEIIEFDDEYNIKRSLFVENINKIEKNWIAIPDKPFTFVWWNDPLTIIHINKDNGKIESKKILDISLGNVSGSTPLILYKDKYIGIVHKRINGHYAEAFITYSKDFTQGSLSDFWRINHNANIEFISGIAYNDNNIYIAMSLNDVLPIIIKVPEDVFDLWIGGGLKASGGTWDYLNQARKCIDMCDYKRSLNILTTFNRYEYIILFLWLCDNNKYGYVINGNRELLTEYILSLNEFPDKYYMLSVLNSMIGEEYNEYLNKAKQLGLPSPFFNRFFNEQYL